MFNKSIKILSALLLILFAVSCSSDQEDTNPEEQNENEEVDVNTATVWNGANITFTKDDGADPTAEANQDRITDNVWITRGNDGGEIFNASSESGSRKGTSPAGTLWAEGSIGNRGNLTFRSFRDAVGNPKDVVGKNLVMFIPNDNVVMTILFTAWTQGKQGGFSYERSTE